MTDIPETYQILFDRGLEAYQRGNYYEAHDHWEELWRHYDVRHRKYIQGLIQLSASLYKIQCEQMRGARSLLSKAREKFDLFTESCWGLDTTRLKKEMHRMAEEISDMADASQFKFADAPRLP